MPMSECDRRRSAEPEPAVGRERRPPQQLYVPPRRRLGGASSGFNRPSSPGFSTCSEIVTSWRARDTPPVRSSSPGPLSPPTCRPPAGPRRRPSQPGPEADLTWRQSTDSLGSSRPSSRQGQCPTGSPSKRPGRRRRRGGRSRSHEHLLDQPSPAVTPPSAPWRREQRDSWDGGQPGRSPSPSLRAPAPRPLFQQPYQPPRARDRRPPSDPPTPASPVSSNTTSPYHDNRLRQSPARSLDRHQQQRTYGQSRDRQRKNQDLPAPDQCMSHSLCEMRRQDLPAPDQSMSHSLCEMGRQDLPAPDQSMSHSLCEMRQQELADDATKGASLPRSRRRRGSRRRRRGQDGGAATRPQDEQRRACSLPRSPSPTALLARFRGSASPPKERAAPAPQSPTDIIASLRERDAAADALEPPSPTVLLQQLMLAPGTTPHPRQLVNTTDDEKASLSQQRGRGRGRGQAGRAPPNARSPQPSPLRRPVQQPSPLRRPGQPAGHADRGSAEPAAPPAGSSAGYPAALGRNVSPSKNGATDGLSVSSGRHTKLHISIPNYESPKSAHGWSDDYKLSGEVVRTTSARGSDAHKSANIDKAPVPYHSISTSTLESLKNLSDSSQIDSSPQPFNDSQGAGVSGLPQHENNTASRTDPPPASPKQETATHSVGGGGSPSAEAAGSPLREARPSRRHSSASSGRDFFNTSLDEPFDWADEVEAWERRCNEESGVEEPPPVVTTSPTKKPSRPVEVGSGASSPSKPTPSAKSASSAGLPEHVIELYNFPASFGQRDLTTVFQALAERGLRILRVDDTHALAVFENVTTASEALRLQHPLLLSRRLSEASARSRQQALVAGHVEPARRPRPATSALHASRLVAGALGVPHPQPSESRDRERRKLRDAKDHKRQAAKQRQDAWDGRF